MSPYELIFVIAVVWFCYGCAHMAVVNYRLLRFPRRFGHTDILPLAELSSLADAAGEDLPSFNIVVPAYRETQVIEGTLHRLADLNYPVTHYRIWAVTYEDEPVEAGRDSTRLAALRAERAINAAAGCNLVTTLSVPSGFDGHFPGAFDQEAGQVGKSCGLNFALRSIHEHNEREERSVYIGEMARRGHLAAVDRVLREAEASAGSGKDAFGERLTAFADRSSPHDIGPLVLSSQLGRAHRLLQVSWAVLGPRHPATCLLTRFVEAEAPRFFALLEHRQDGEAPPTLSVMEDRRFLLACMEAVESGSLDGIMEEADRVIARLRVDRPALARALAAAASPEDVFQLARRINSRWMAVYDADADAPVEVLRHLAVRILREPDLMGFQGPVAPVANYAVVHPLCKLGGLWMCIWHNSFYPRLLTKKDRIHVLAGTNWCFRIDGMEDNGRLVRTPAYDERRRRFILSFDPSQLTEDFEIGVRMFSRWRLNAAWHPCVEYEQVPASPRAMIVQRSRWALGTLQTLAALMHSNVPAPEKLRFLLLPLQLLVSGAGPVMSVLVIILLNLHDIGFLAHPAVRTLTLALTAGNLLYVLPFVIAHARHVGNHRRDSGMEKAIVQCRLLEENFGARLERGDLDSTEAALVREIGSLLETGSHRDGFLARYLEGRAVDDAAGNPRGAGLLRKTPGALMHADVSLFGELRHAGKKMPSLPFAGGQDRPAQSADALGRLRDALREAGREGEWDALFRRERRLIYAWILPYIVFELIPYYTALWRWLVWRQPGEWIKTPRTSRQKSTR